MQCAPCTIERYGTEGTIPEAVTQIGGTAVCARCAREVADTPGAARDAALRPVLMRQRRGGRERLPKPS